MSGIPEDEIKEVFNTFDTDHSGSIDTSELINILNELNVANAEDVANQLISEADKNGDNKITYEEFKKALA